jgi:hypothetical protein
MNAHILDTTDEQWEVYYAACAAAYRAKAAGHRAEAHALRLRPFKSRTTAELIAHAEEMAASYDRIADESEAGEQP